MDNEDARIQMKALIKEYFAARGWTNEEREDYRTRLKAFFADQAIREELFDEFRESGVGESFYMAHGYRIMS